MALDSDSLSVKEIARKLNAPKFISMNPVANDPTSEASSPAEPTARVPGVQNMAPTGFARVRHLVWILNRLQLRLGLALLFLVGLAYTIFALSNTAANTFAVSIAAFAMMLAMANGFFAFGRSIDDNPDLKDKLGFCGERALHAAICLMCAAIVKWGLTEFQAIIPRWELPLWWIGVADYTCRVGTALLFFAGLVEAHRALEQTVLILDDRRARRVDVPR